MLLTASCRRDSDPGCSGAAERLRSVRERLEAAGSGLVELELLRQRQEDLVRAVLELRDQGREERLLEENISLLRKQLHCLRRRDAGLMSQLQELDRQISDLRLDTEASHDPVDTDSRPSSGFYDLSDGASASLSNSSNSVFSECFCSVADADGQLLSTEELASCLECDGLVGGLFVDPSSSGTVRCSLSGPQPPTPDAPPPSDLQSKYHCDLVSRNGSDVYRYPSPLHAVAVQSSVFLQMLGHGGHGGHGLDEGFSVSGGAAGEGLKLDRLTLPPPVPENSSSSSSHKRLDGYIHNLLQRRATPIRTGRPRTSINTDPSKSLLRPASLCARPSPGLNALRGSELKPPWPAGGGGALTSSPQRQWSLDGKGEEQETQNGFSCGSSDTFQNGVQTNVADLAQTESGSAPCNSNQPDTNAKKRGLPLHPPVASTLTLPKDVREMGSPKANPSLTESRDPPPKAPHVLKTQSTPQNPPQPRPLSQTRKGEGSVPEAVSLSYSAHNQGDGGRGVSHMVSAEYAPSQRHNTKLRKGGGTNVNIITAKSAASMKVNQASGHLDSKLERRADELDHRLSAKKCCLVKDRGSAHLKLSKQAAVEGSAKASKRIPASAPEGRVPDEHATSSLASARSVVAKLRHHGNHQHSSGHHHHHRRDPVVVVAKPKYKRKDYGRLRAIAEVPYDEAFRRIRRRQRKELLSQVAHAAGSESEYSAECASLFHSTIADTSEDERSNYTTNCFGDSEDEFEDESVTTDNSEENGGGGAKSNGTDQGRSYSDAAGVRGEEEQEMIAAQTKAFVKIKASHNLKKKILRFRSGSLKLMTTV